MADDLLRTLDISGAGMRTQGARLRVISENVANVNSTATEPGDLPYRRKIITFKNELDRNLGVDIVKVDEIKPTFPTLVDGLIPITRQRTKTVTS